MNEFQFSTFKAPAEDFDFDAWVSDFCQECQPHVAKWIDSDDMAFQIYNMYLEFSSGGNYLKYPYVSVDVFSRIAERWCREYTKSNIG